MDLTPHPNLLSDPALTSVPATMLPQDPAAGAALAAGSDMNAAAQVANTFPSSSLAWALLAEDALGANSNNGDGSNDGDHGEDGTSQDSERGDHGDHGDHDDTVQQLRNAQAYAFARTGYHRGLDVLRRNGWRGTGPIPYEHEPNRGFLRALAALARSAERIGETDEAQRCTDMLYESSPTGYRELLGDA